METIAPSAILANDSSAPENKKKKKGDSDDDVFEANAKPVTKKIKKTKK
jgi:hypothetical protein